jgi:hypothetical protein
MITTTGYWLMGNPPDAGVPAILMVSRSLSKPPNPGRNELSPTHLVILFSSSSGQTYRSYAERGHAPRVAPAPRPQELQEKSRRSSQGVKAEALAPYKTSSLIPGEKGWGWGQIIYRSIRQKQPEKTFQPNPEVVSCGLELTFLLEKTPMPRLNSIKF